MNLRCYCGHVFNLSYKVNKQLLHEFELFCSPECVLDYINDFEPAGKSIRKYPPQVDNIFDCWDSVTQRGYRSLYEVYFARFLFINSIEFEYEPCAFKLGTKTYTPDFYIPHKDLYVECKGRWGSGAKDKIRKISKEIDIILLPGYLQKEFQKYWKRRIKN